MKIRIISVGRASDPSTSQMLEEYTKRLQKWTTLEWQFIPPGRDIDYESGQILRAVRDNDFVILLDEHGKMADNPQMVRQLETWLMGSRPLTFVIGGAYGVTQDVHDRADFVWSFSQLVFPHQLMRVLLLEQLYRTFSLRDGGKYHHA